MKKEILIDNFLIQEVIKIMMKAHESILNIYSLSKFEIDYKQNNTCNTSRLISSSNNNKRLK